MSKLRKAFRIVAVAGVLTWTGAAVLVPASASTTPAVVPCGLCA
ncbi:hypothetical protein [Catenulispora pinisilvae]|nr:hypothetical protein [Catenulispora pinisilvae]